MRIIRFLALCALFIVCLGYFIQAENTTRLENLDLPISSESRIISIPFYGKADFPDLVGMQLRVRFPSQYLSYSDIEASPEFKVIIDSATDFVYFMAQQEGTIQDGWKAVRIIILLGYAGSVQQKIDMTTEKHIGNLLLNLNGNIEPGTVIPLEFNNLISSNTLDFYNTFVGAGSKSIDVSKFINGSVKVGILKRPASPKNLKTK